jgi:hypothetical protein
MFLNDSINNVSKYSELFVGNYKFKSYSRQSSQHNKNLGLWYGCLITPIQGIYSVGMDRRRQPF